MSKYLTPKEFANAAGISVQAVYKQMGTRLLPYVTTTNGKRKISTAALGEFYTGVEQPKAKKGENVEKLEQRLKELEIVVEMLEKQAKENEQEREFLKLQVEKKDAQIDNLNESLKATADALKMTNQLAAADKKRLLELEEKQKDQEQAEAEPVEAPATDPEAETVEPAPPGAAAVCPAADPEQPQEKPPEKPPAPRKGLGAFLSRFFG